MQKRGGEAGERFTVCRAVGCCGRREGEREREGEEARQTKEELGRHGDGAAAPLTMAPARSLSTPAAGAAAMVAADANSSVARRAGAPLSAPVVGTPPMDVVKPRRNASSPQSRTSQVSLPASCFALYFWSLASARLVSILCSLRCRSRSK